MSWDVIILNVPNDIKIDGDLADDTVRPLGSRDEVLRAITTAFPHADVSDPNWIALRGDGYTIELSLEETEYVGSLTLFVRGSVEAVDAIECLCKAGGWRAFDTSLGDFIDFASSQRDTGLKRWQQYRDQVLKRSRSD